MKYYKVKETETLVRGVMESEHGKKVVCIIGQVWELIKRSIIFVENNVTENPDAWLVLPAVVLDGFAIEKEFETKADAKAYAEMDGVLEHSKSQNWKA